MEQAKAKWIQEAHQKVVNGQGQSVRAQLRKIQKRGVPKAEVLDVALLARRVGMYHFATNLLYPLIPKLREKAENKDQEALAAYASCNTSIGNYRESIEIFQQLSPETLTDFSIEYADCLFRTWNYKEAEHFLKDHCPRHLKSYRDLVLGLNLAAALKENGKTEEALSWIKELKSFSDKHQYQLIRANCLEIEGQIQFEKSNYREAETLCSEAELILSQSHNISWLFAKKWKLFSQLAQDSDASKRMNEIEDLKNLARSHSFWEMLRECDLFQSIFSNDSSLYNKVYFGTPHKHFKSRAQKFAKNQFKLEPIIQLNDGPDNQPMILEVLMGEGLFAQGQEGWTSQSRKLLGSLCQDLYRPVSVYEIFHHVFEETYFNPFTSKERVYKAIKKLKDLLAKHPSQAFITSNKKYGYRFRAEHPLSIVYRESSEKAAPQNLRHLKLIADQWGHEPFKRSEFEQLADISLKKANRILKKAVEDGSVRKIGKGAQVLYTLSPTILRLVG